jgi:tetratricopeptide (TPR) repeat protein
LTGAVVRSTRRDALFFALLALAFRLAFTFETRADPVFDLLVIDARFYHDLALRLAAGHFGSGPLWYAPLYPAMLAVLFRTLGDDPKLVVAMQFVFGAATAALGVGMGARFSRLAGRVAGGLLALSPVLVFYDNQLLYASLAVFLTAAFLFGFVRLAGGAGKGRAALGNGLVFGLLLLTRTNAMLFAPLGAALLVWQRGVRTTAIFTAGAALAMLPVLLWNGIGGGAWTPLTVNGGMILATGFAEDSVGGRTLQRTPDDFGPGGAYQREAEQATGRAMTLAEASDWHKARTLEKLREDPMRAASLTLRKLRLLFTAREIDDNLGFESVRERAWTLRWWPAPWAWILIAAGAGVGAALRRTGAPRRDALALLAFAVAYGGSLLLLFLNARYRVPLVVPGAVFAGVAVAAVRDAVRARRWRGLVVPALGAAALAGPVLADPGVRIDRAYEWNALGAALLNHGDPRAGLALLDRAVAADSRMAGAHLNRSLALLALGRNEEAYAAAVEATRFDAALADAWQTQGAILARAGRVADALPAFRKAAELRPDDAAAQRNLAQALAVTGDLAGAVEAGRRAVAAGDRAFAGQVEAWEAQVREAVR